MKLKKLLSALLAGVMISSSALNVIADTENLLDINGDNLISGDVVASGSAVDSATTAYLFGSAKTPLTAGTYDLSLQMMKVSDITTASMAGSCIKSGTLTVGEDGVATVRVDLQAVSLGSISDWADQWKIYQANTPSGEMVDAEAHTNSDGYVDQITFTLPDNSYDGVYVNMFIGAMNFAQDAYLAFDYSGLGQGVTNTYTGTARVTQFGEYNVNVTVTVTDGIITGITVEGSDFSGTYAEFNKTKLQAAIDGLKEAFNGKSAYDGNGIDGVEAVTGATYSSNAIKEAILNALSLAVEDDVINIPTEKLAQGEYTVDIAFYTDNVKHSLVENDTAKATIKVDADGKLTLTTDIINGTTKEPLYVLDFNGYYENNDTSAALKTDAVVTKSDVNFSDEYFAEGTQAVTNVTFPLEGDYAAIYNTNATIYVPAMKNLNGQVSGIEFENGKFTSDCFAKVYWDSIEKVDDSEAITVADGNYTADISILKIDSNDISSASRSFTTTAVPIEVKGGKAYVRLAYTSPMIEKIEQLVDGSYVELEKTVTDEGNYVDVVLDNIADIETIQFTINTGTAMGIMVNQARVRVNTETLKEVVTVADGNYTADISILKIDSDDISSASRSFTTTAVPIEVKGGKAYVRLAYTSPMIEKIEQLADGSYVELEKTVTDEGNYVDVVLDNIADIETIQFTINTGTAMGIMVNQARVKVNIETLEEVVNVPIYEYGSAKTVLEPGTYKIPAALMNASNITSPSMAGSCIVGAEVTINEDGSALVKVNLQPVAVGAISDWADKWNVYQSNYASGEVKPAIEGINADGNVESIMFTLPDNSFDGVYVNMFVPAMNYSPDAYLALDFVNAQIKEEETTTEATTESSTETTTESSTESTTESPIKAVKYSVPVKMVQAANPSLESMGNGAIDGNAIVTVGNGKSTVELSFKAYTLSGLYGHLLNLWSYPVTDAMDYSWWNNAEYEIPAEVVETYIDYGLNYTEGDTTQSEFVKTLRITRDAEKEDSIYIRISVDAMAGFDQAARLDLDWDNAQVIDEVEVSTESTTEIIENSTESTTEDATEGTTTSNGGSNSNDMSDELEDGKYWMDIALWNANLDQPSMGDSAFENNRRALVTISGNTARVEIASNPVIVTGYTSALMDIKSSDVSISIDGRESFTTNTRYDGQEHTFDYATKFSFDLGELNKEFIPVEICVPYTPMDGIVASAGGYVSARLKLDWGSLTKTDNNDSLDADSSTASGSVSSGSGGGSVNANNENTGIRIEADEFVFDDGTIFETNLVTSGTEYDTAKSVFGEYTDFRLFAIKALFGDNEVNPNGIAKVYIPVEDNDGEDIEIYRITEGDNNTEAGKTLLEYELSTDGKYYIITVKEFGLFAVAKTDGEIILTEDDEKVGTEKTEDSGMDFKDIDDHWAEDYILAAVEKGLFNGVESDTFAPDMATTRAMFVTIIGRLKGISEDNNGDITFKDVNENDYFYPFVVWASENDVVEGISADTFAPSINITREQMAAMLYRFVQSEGIKLDNIAKTDFNDAERISLWAQESVEALSRAGIINGRTDGNFDPKGNATRAEIATVLMNFINKYMPEV